MPGPADFGRVITIKRIGKLLLCPETGMELESGMEGNIVEILRWGDLRVKLNGAGIVYVPRANWVFSESDPDMAAYLTNNVRQQRRQQRRQQKRQTLR